MKKTALMIRCVPRFGYDNTEVRTIDVDVVRDAEREDVLDAVGFFFASRGIADAVYDVDADDDGYFAVINDEVFEHTWGTPLL